MYSYALSSEFSLSVPSDKCRKETRQLYAEIFLDGGYFKHGIAIQAGDTVLDVGANVGLFTLYCCSKHEGLTVHAFEPAPPAFACLEQNVQRITGSRVHTHCLGLWGQSGNRAIKFLEHAPANSTFFPEGKLSEGNILAECLFAAQHQASVKKYFNRVFSQGHEFECRMTTLDEIVSAAVPRVDLLKIDVEGAELEVLAGICDENLSRARQVVIEISSYNKDRLPAVAQRFTRLGFEVAVEGIIPGMDHMEHSLPCLLFARGRNA